MAIANGRPGSLWGWLQSLDLYDAFLSAMHTDGLAMANNVERNCDP
jgi:hypothetical protein